MAGQRFGRITANTTGWQRPRGVRGLDSVSAAAPPGVGTQPSRLSRGMGAHLSWVPHDGHGPVCGGRRTGHRAPVPSTSELSGYLGDPVVTTASCRTAAPVHWCRGKLLSLNGQASARARPGVYTSKNIAGCA